MLREILEKYLEIFPEDRSKLKLLQGQLNSSERLDDRRNFRGHIAGDAIILSSDLKKVLFIHHLRMNKWQQPGGHWDPGEAGPWETAEREAGEETGIKNLTGVNLVESDHRVPLHIITGPVPPHRRKKEPRHWHHDFRYGFIAQTEKLGKIVDEGIGGAKWFMIEQARQRKDYGHETFSSVERLLKLIDSRLKA